MPNALSPQENGHVIYNGDMTPKAGIEVTPQNGNGSAEPPKEESEGEAGGADTIEPAPAATSDGGDPKPEGAAAPKDAPKKKKKFSFKKSFKLSGISFRKNKKEAGDSSGSSPTEEQQGKSAETPPGGLQPSAPPEEEEQQSGPGEGGEGAEPKDGGEAAGSQEEEKQQGGESHGDTAKPEEPSKSAGLEPTTEQKEE